MTGEVSEDGRTAPVDADGKDNATGSRTGSVRKRPPAVCRAATEGEESATMRTRLLATLACWLGLAALLPAQPINPGGNIVLPVDTTPSQDATVDCDAPRFTNPTFFIGLDGLLWWTKSSRVDRPIVGALTNPSENFLSSPTAGGISDPNTVILYGNEKIDHDIRWGIRGTAQIGFDDMNAYVLELVGMYLPRQTERTAFNAPALDLLFNNVTNGFPGTQSAFPVNGVVGGTQLAGSILIETHSDFWGAECNFAHRFNPRGCPVFGEILIGYRHQGLSEGLSITAGNPSSAFEDSFKTNNFFNGGQLGVGVGVEWWHLSAQVTFKGAVGLTNMDLLIDSANFNSPLGHLYVQPSNFDKTSTTQLGLIGECTTSVTWSIAPNVAISGGYNYIYWSRVLRATNQVDSNINFNQSFAGQPISPLPREQRSEFWAQGFVASLEFMF
jgi:hypothetical protein